MGFFRSDTATQEEIDAVQAARVANPTEAQFGFRTASGYRIIGENEIRSWIGGDGPGPDDMPIVRALLEEGLDRELVSLAEGSG